MRIIGADVCKASIVCWELSEVPKDLRACFRKNKRRSSSKDPDPLTFYANRPHVHSFVSLLKGTHPLSESNEPCDAIIFEPTGVHYSWIWARIAEQEGFKVLWVGHQEAVHYRKQNRLPDKNDQADALALAAYGLLHWHQEQFFLHFHPFPITRIRELYFQFKSLARIQSPIINRGRQQLAREFPEAALKKSQQSKVDGLSPLWAWLAGEQRSLKRKATYYERMYSDSFAPEYGVTISPFTREFLADMLCRVHRWELKVEDELRHLLNAEEFAPYMATFAQFGIPMRSAALILSQIYPVTRFENIGAFKRRLGMGRVEVSSGDKDGTKTDAGSKMCRSELYMWVLDNIAPVHARPKNSIGVKLGEFYDERSQRFKDPKLREKKQLEQVLKQQEQMLANMQRMSQSSLVPDTLALQIKQMESSLSTMRTLCTQLLNSGVSLKDVLPGASHQQTEGFGKLIVCQTAAYGCRLLFKQLKKAVL